MGCVTQFEISAMKRHLVWDRKDRDLLPRAEFEAREKLLRRILAPLSKITKPKHGRPDNHPRDER